MSSHYIFIACSTPGCEARGSIYTGEDVVEGFEQDQWEMETICVPCDEHLIPPPVSGSV